MDLFLEFVNALLSGNRKYALGLILGASVLGLLVMLYSKLKKREAKLDQDYLEQHPEVSAAVLKSKARRLVLTTVLVLFGAMPLTMFAVIQVFKKQETVDPAIPVLMLFGIFCLSLLLAIVYAIRLARIRRRIKVLEDKAT
jgi:sterol desaturase/sphingolipid hydroxylase (fatty acid hydroxylase superfamily)